LRTFKLALPSIVWLAASSAFAAQINHASSGLASPAATITFGEVVLTNGDPITNEYAGYGVTFSSLFYNTQDTSGFGLTPPAIMNFDFTTTFPNFSIFFSTDQTDVAFQLITNPGDSTTITALLNSVVVDTFVGLTDLDGPNSWFGFTGLSPFDEIRFQVSGVGPAGIDTIQLGTAPEVPEPATYTLLGVGLAAIGLRKRLGNR